VVFNASKPVHRALLWTSTDAWLVPENGFFIRKGGRDQPWEVLGENVDLSWVQEVEDVLNYFVQRTPKYGQAALNSIKSARRNVFIFDGLAVKHALIVISGPSCPPGSGRLSRRRSRI